MFKFDADSQMKALEAYYGFKRPYSITWMGHFGCDFGENGE
jgi:hypothetical protein